MKHPEELNQDTLFELRNLVKRYPYFQTLRLLYLKNLYQLHDQAFGEELRNTVPYVADRRMLFYLIETGDAAMQPSPIARQPAAAMEEEPAVDRTLFLINSFLSIYPDEQQPQPAGLDYSMDYTAYLLKEEETTGTQEELPDGPKLRGQSLIDDFIMQSEEAGTSPVKPASQEGQCSRPVESLATSVASDSEQAEEEGSGIPSADDLDDSCFTETLAKIYIKQHRYEKALEIIKKLSLNYPRKNVYFADQIRFLEKLIINAKSK